MKADLHLRPPIQAECREDGQKTPGLRIQERSGGGNREIMPRFHPQPQGSKYHFENNSRLHPKTPSRGSRAPVKFPVSRQRPSRASPAKLCEPSRLCKLGLSILPRAWLLPRVPAHLSSRADALRGRTRVLRVVLAGVSQAGMRSCPSGCLSVVGVRRVGAEGGLDDNPPWTREGSKC